MTAHVLHMAAPAAGWRRALPAFLAVLALIVIAYFETGASMVAIWNRSETFAHAFVVPPIVLWLVWRRREDLRRITPRPMPSMLPAMALAGAAWLLAELVVVNSAAQLAFTALLVLAVPVVLGRQVAWTLAFPLTFLFFAVPIGEFMTAPMMQWTADFTVQALRATGIPVYREGQQFIIPSGHWSVVEACSGVRYLMASFMVGSLFAYLNYHSLKRRLVFVAVSIILPIVANWLRAYIIVMLGHLSNNQIATGADHLVYGWVFFGVIILGMFFVGARWSEPEEPALAQPSPEVSVPGPGWWSWGVAAAAAVLVLWPHLMLQRMQLPGDVRTPAIELPHRLSVEWSSSTDPVTDWQPIFVGAGAKVHRTYANANGRVGVYLAYYRGQTDSGKLISSRNTLVDTGDRNWNQLSTGSRDVALGQGRLAVRTGELLATARQGNSTRPRLQVWCLYWVDGRLTSNDVHAKLLAAWQRLRGGDDDSAALVLHAQEAEAGASAALLEAFLRDNIEALTGLLQSARSAR